MDSRQLHAFFRFGVFIFVCSLVLVFLQPPGSAEYVVSVCSTLIGAVMLLLVLVILRLTR
ncbi:MAG: hypothetical protein SF029_22780 [bacterium]|jgi:hypothetical protein|nr:hypothetical protein [bacterium]